MSEKHEPEVLQLSEYLTAARRGNGIILKDDLGRTMHLNRQELDELQEMFDD